MGSCQVLVPKAWEHRVLLNIERTTQNLIPLQKVGVLIFFFGHGGRTTHPLVPGFNADTPLFECEGFSNAHAVRVLYILTLNWCICIARAKLSPFPNTAAYSTKVVE
jgi:hypothetical protein